MRRPLRCSTGTTAPRRSRPAGTPSRGPTWPATRRGVPARDTVYTMRHRRRLIAHGVCTKCRARVESGAWRCDRCAAEVAALHRSRRARFKATGLCQHFGRRPPAAGRVQCRPCLDALGGAGTGATGDRRLPQDDGERLRHYTEPFDPRLRLILSAGRFRSGQPEPMRDEGGDVLSGERARLAVLRPVALRARKALNGPGCHAVALANGLAKEASDLRRRRPLMISDSDRRTTHGWGSSPSAAWDGGGSVTGGAIASV